MNVALQSDEGGFSVQANRASCVFGSPKLFGHPKTNLPGKSRGIFLQSRKIWKKSNHKFPKVHERKLKEKMGRKPKADPAIHRYGIKLTNEENVRFEAAFSESGMKEKQDSSRNPFLEVALKL